MSNFNVIIVGGGLAGPLLASGLLQKGIKVDVYERLEENAKRDGYNIRVAQPCLQAFEECLDAKAIDQIKQRMGRFEDNQETTPIWYDYRMKPLLNMSRISTKYHDSAPMDRVVLRNTIIQKPLSQGIMHHGKAFSRYEIVKTNSGQEKVRVWFQDDTSVDGDILIAADGSHSTINKQVGLNHIQQLDAISFIAKVKLSKEMLDKLPKPYLPGARQEKVDQKKGKEGLDFDNQTASFTFNMSLPTADCPPDIEERDTDQIWQFLSESIPAWHQDFRQIIDVVRGEDIHTFRPQATVRPSLDWRKNVRSAKEPLPGHPRVWLMGDAMHAMMPNRGMGGNQAMLDAKVILPFLERLNHLAKTTGAVSEEAIGAACAEYEREMIPRAFEWVESSGGTKPIPFDTNSFFGWISVWCLIFGFQIKDMLNALFGKS
ncbi:hypothetical protein EDB82DRAFT_520176 [Fusarium venenatum]|uniref:uncharacterized protein n=1 Tax=Fusarium venenatum TaxID=56646 RepID=UPI001DE26447|nr:hypothetical protein EDB82DRAFT_520176 [Fusarium venenatum]